MFIGPDRTGNLYEIGVVSTDEGPIVVHAMKARSKYRKWDMPRTADEIINQAEELAARFEDHEPDQHAVRDATALREVRRAFLARAGAEQRVIGAVEKARADGHSWTSIGAMLGTSGEAARQRYGQKSPRS